LKAIRAETPEYAAIHTHVVQGALARLDKTYQAFFQRVQRGEKAGFPRFKGAQALPLLHMQARSWRIARRVVGQRFPHSLHDRADCCRLAPTDGRAPKTVAIAREANGSYVAISCTDVPTPPVPRTGQETV
jgi:putative transposase